MDKQQQGEERGLAAGSTAMGGTARELRKDSADRGKPREQGEA